MKIYYVKPDWYDMGSCEAKSPGGHLVRAYDRERTLCDMIRRRKATDPAAYRYALRRYAGSPDKNLLNLERILAEDGDRAPGGAGDGGASVIKNPRRVKDLIRNKAQGDSTKAQTLQRHYAMERFLERISVSRYRDNFILKGGMLVSSMIGIDQRSTMDVDATMTGQTLSPANALRIVGEIAAIELDDDMTFEVGDPREIMKDAEYEGVQIPIRAYLGRMEIKLKIDISTGDAITPSKIAFQFPLMLEDRKIDIWAYNLETVLAEKAETVIVRGVLNTRHARFLRHLHANDRV